MKEYRVHYFYGYLTELTGFEQGDIINREQLDTLITEEKVNVMVYHNTTDDSSICFIDDKRFQQR